MIPENSPIMQEEFEIKIYPTKTYLLDDKNGRIGGMIDGLEAMMQTVQKILNTERFEYTGYSMNYGIETVDLYGEPMTYVLSEIKERITDALTWDTRINSVDSFEQQVEGNKLICKFVVHTIHGDLDAEKAVEI